MARGARAYFLDYAPAVALLGFWALAGLGGAIEVARVSGDLRHVALGVVTVPSLMLIVLAIRRAHRFVAVATCERPAQGVVRQPRDGDR